MHHKVNEINRNRNSLKLYFIGDNWIGCALCNFLQCNDFRQTFVLTLATYSDTKSCDSGRLSSGGREIELNFQRKKILQNYIL